MNKYKEKMQEFKRKVFTYYEALPTSIKVSVYIVVVLLVMVFLAYYTYPRRVDNVAKPKQAVILKEDKFVQEKWLNSAERKVAELERKIRELEAKLEEANKRSGQIGNGEDLLQKLNKKNESNKEELLAYRINEVIQKAPIKGGEVKLEELAPPSPVYPKEKSVPADKVIKKALGDEQVKREKVKNALESPQGSQKQVNQQQVYKSMAIIEIKSDENATNTNQEKSRKLYIPPTTFVKGVLLTGLDAPTGVKSTNTPHPVLIRLQDLSFLPNEVRQNILGCRLLGEGYGELSSERAYIRLVNLSCIDNKSREVISVDTKGYVADSDGKIGLRGEVVSKQGMFLARSLVAAFIEGVSEGFRTSQQTIITSADGVVSSNNIENFKDGFVSGFSGGAAKAAEKLSEFYMKLAEEIFPVIEIGALRGVTVVFTAPIEAEFMKKFDM